MSHPRPTAAAPPLAPRSAVPPDAVGAIPRLAPDGLVEGYASLFGAVDLGHDIVLPGAFRDTIRARGPRAVRMLWQHDPAEPIGTWETIEEDVRGLFVRGRLAVGSRRARDALALIRAGAVDGLSIGFRALRARRDRPSGVRRIEKADLWEISIVTFPLLPGARVAPAVERARPPPANEDHAAALRSLAATLRAAGSGLRA